MAGKSSKQHLFNFFFIRLRYVCLVQVDRGRSPVVLEPQISRRAA